MVIQFTKLKSVESCCVIVLQYKADRGHRDGVCTMYTLS